MIIITKDNISNYLTDQDINIIDKNINKCYYFRGLNELIKDTNNKIIYNHKYYFISYINNWVSDLIYIINNNNYNDINIYIKYNNKDKYNIINKHNLQISVLYLFRYNKKTISYNNKNISYFYNNNYKIIKMDNKVKKIFLNYYIYYNNYSSLYYYNNYFLFILKTSKYKNYLRIKSNLNNNINNLLFFVYI